MRSSTSAIFGCIVALLKLNSVHSSGRVNFTDGGNHTITSDYEDANIYVLNKTSLTFNSGYFITAPSSTDYGEEAIRVQDSFFYAQSGVIVGAAGIGGTGVTITTNKERGSTSYATFETGIEVYGGSAGREHTTKGGNAVQILQMGSEVTFNGGKFTPGTGCTLTVCGVQTDDGNAIQILYGKSIIKGGVFEGNIYSISGIIEVHGCVDFDGEMITGYLMDGERIDVKYVGEENDLQIMYNNATCQEDETSANEVDALLSGVGLCKSWDVAVLSLVFGTILFS